LRYDHEAVSTDRAHEPDFRERGQGFNGFTVAKPDWANLSHAERRHDFSCRDHFTRSERELRMTATKPPNCSSASSS